MKQFERTFNIGDWMTDFVDRMTRFSKGEVLPAKVPCAGCQACCHQELVQVDDKDDIEFLSTHTENGGIYLDHRPDGGCIHLTDKGCGVYDHRPRVCQIYDCRYNAMTGTTMIDQPFWAMSPKISDELWLALIAFTIMRRFMQVPREILSWDLLASSSIIYIAGELATTVEQHYIFLDPKQQRSVWASHMKVWRVLEKGRHQTFISGKKVRFDIPITLFDFVDNWQQMLDETLIKLWGRFVAVSKIIQKRQSK